MYICAIRNRPIGCGEGRVQVVQTNPPTAWKGPLGGLLTKNLTGLKHVVHR